MSYFSDVGELFLPLAVELNKHVRTAKWRRAFIIRIAIALIAKSGSRRNFRVTAFGSRSKWSAPRKWEWSEIIPMSFGNNNFDHVTEVAH